MYTDGRRFLLRKHPVLREENPECVLSENKAVVQPPPSFGWPWPVRSKASAKVRIVNRIPAQRPR
jgi:hypothetical protein